MAAICLYGGIDVLVSGGRMALANVTFPLNGTTPSDAPVGMMTSTSDSHFDTTPLPPRTDPLDHFNPDNNQAVRVLEQSMTKISNAVGTKNIFIYVEFCNIYAHNSLKSRPNLQVAY